MHKNLTEKVKLEWDIGGIPQADEGFQQRENLVTKRRGGKHIREFVQRVEAVCCSHGVACVSVCVPGDGANWAKDDVNHALQSCRGSSTLLVGDVELLKIFKGS